MSKSWEDFFEAYFDRMFCPTIRACYESLREANDEGAQAHKEAKLSAFIRKEQTRARALLREMYNAMTREDKPSHNSVTPTPTKRVGV